MLSRPTATPRRCSALAPRWASLSHTTVMPSREDRAAANGAFTQPRLGANLTTPSRSPTAPGTATPIPRQRRSRILPQGVLDHLGQGLHHAQHVVLAAMVRALATGQHLAAERDAGHGVAVDTEVDADDRDVVSWLDDVAGASVAVGADRAGLRHQAQVDE